LPKSPVLRQRITKAEYVFQVSGIEMVAKKLPQQCFWSLFLTKILGFILR